MADQPFSQKYGKNLWLFCVFVLLSGAHLIMREIFQSGHIFAARTLQWNNVQESSAKDQKDTDKHWESEWGREKNIPTVRWGKHLHTVGLLSHHLTPLCPRSCSFTLDVLCMSALSEIPLLSGRAAPITVLPGLWAFWARQRRWGSVWWCEASNPQRGREGSRPTCMSLYLYNQAIHRR